MRTAVKDCTTLPQQDQEQEQEQQQGREPRIEHKQAMIGPLVFSSARSHHHLHFNDTSPRG